VLYVCMCIAMRKEDNDMGQAMFPAKKNKVLSNISWPTSKKNKKKKQPFVQQVTGPLRRPPDVSKEKDG